MYICPTCNKQFNTEESIVKHFTRCWKEQHPYHTSKDAPHSENVITRTVNSEVADFFRSLNNG